MIFVSTRGVSLKRAKKLIPKSDIDCVWISINKDEVYLWSRYDREWLVSSYNNYQLIRARQGIKPVIAVLYGRFMDLSGIVNIMGAEYDRSVCQQ